MYQYFQKVMNKKNLEIFFFDVLKVSDKNSRIRFRIRIRTKISWIHNTGFEASGR